MTNNIWDSKIFFLFSTRFCLNSEAWNEKKCCEIQLQFITNEIECQRRKWHYRENRKEIEIQLVSTAEVTEKRQASQKS